jgi:hypothetical protein
MTWDDFPNLRRRPSTPSKGRGPVQVRIKRAFTARGVKVLSSSEIYSWSHVRRRLGRCKSMPAGIYNRTTRTHTRWVALRKLRFLERRGLMPRKCLCVALVAIFAVAASRSAQAQVTLDVTRKSTVTNSCITKSVSLGSSPRGSAVTIVPNATTE